MALNLQKFRWALGQHPIAYMSAEFGLDDRLHIYSGGLGILAGDIIRAANDLELPFVAVGLLYKEGYFRQKIDKNGQSEEYPIMNIAEAPVNLVIDTDGDPIKISIPVEHHLIHFQIWEYSEGDVSVYLLDTDVPENTPEHQLITRRLYGGDKETRILQEMVLGIGGVRALDALHIHPSIYHLNEGHSAFAIFEITHHYMKELGMFFQEAYEYAAKKIVFTNHTLVPAGNEVFPNSLVKQYLECYTKELGLEIDYVLHKGKSPDQADQFGMSTLALDMAARVNAVSKLHAKMAKEVWPDHEMVGITNGVHLPTWVSADLKAQAPNFDLELLEKLPAEAIWRLHEMAKFRLLDEVEYRTGKELDKDTIIITWARRFASYKRPEILFEDISRLKEMIFQVHQPVQFLMAGKAHPRDDVGHKIIKNIVNAIHDHGLEDHFVFIPNYNMALADVLVAGSDVWLNTPYRGKEASGTSGMKAAANGVLQCSVSDGWVDEIDLNGVGWEIPDKNTGKHVYEIFEKKVIPLYYKRNANGIPEEWVERMRKTMAVAWSGFSANRMLKDYIEFLYQPTLELELKVKHNHNWRRRYRIKHAD
ncbi:MAG: alpha-glucan family phosphorylase [bacterium]|nr:alpha-glucan family phosphorylase [bacterium]